MTKLKGAAKFVWFAVRQEEFLDLATFAIWTYVATDSGQPHYIRWLALLVAVLNLETIVLRKTKRK